MANRVENANVNEGFSPDHIRRMKLDIDENALALLDAQVSQLELTTADLEQRLLRTQAALAVARDSLGSVRSRRDALLLDVQEQRAALGALERIPEELLVAIFGYCAAPPSIDWPIGVAPGSVQPRSHTAPYICAAVSKRWRRAATEAPHLWRYILIPRLSQDDVDGGRYKDYAETSLERSKSSPLVVVHNFIDATFSEHYTKILESISLHIRRCEVFAARLSDHSLGGALLSCLRSGPTPMLKKVLIGVRPEDNYRFLQTDHPSVPVHARYIFYAPRLVNLLIEHLPLPLCATIGSMPALNELTVFQTELAGSFWSMLAGSPALRSLIILTDRDPAAGRKGPIHLPELVYLHVSHKGWRLLHLFPDALVVPKLADLYVSSCSPHEIREFFHRVSPTLAMLRLHFVTIDHDDIPALHTLAGLDSLELRTCTVTPLLFERLVQREECMWPRLEELTLSVTLQPASGESLVEFVRARSSAGAPSEGQDTPDPWCPLQDVIFAEGHNISRGDVAEIQHLLSHA